MRGLGRPAIQFFWGVLCALVASLGTRPVAAQFGGQFPAPVQWTPEQSLLVRLPKEPQLLALLDEAKVLLDAEDYEGAIDSLQAVLEESDDYFTIKDGRPAGSTLDQVEDYLWKMPPEAIETYRRRYEPLAAQRLAAATGRGNLDEMLAVARTYPLTLAAAEVGKVAGDTAFDQGEAALAARLWRRLLPTLDAGERRTTLLIRIAQAWTLAGQPDAATPYLQELSQLAQTSPIDFEGKRLTPPAMADAAWLNKVFGPVHALVPIRPDDWRMNGGHPRRWGQGNATSPVQRGGWSYPLIDEYDTNTAGRDAIFQTLLKDLEKTHLRRGPFVPTRTSPFIVGAPLVVGDTVLVQGVASLKALDAKTGHLRWSGVVPDDTFLYWVWRNYEEKDVNGAHDRLVELFLGQRAWLNQTAAALSSDGSRVFALTSTGMVGAHPRNMFPRNGQPPPSELVPPSDNRLLAYDVSTGLLLWEAGGPSNASRMDETGQNRGELRPLGGAYFLGAPLPIDGALYTLAEDHGQIRLFALDPQTGEEQWSLPLLNPDVGIANDETRRMYGLSPAYAGGLLICPTGEGIVVAVDAMRHRVVWIQQYQQRAPMVDPRAMAMMRFNRQRVGVGDSPLGQMLRQRRWFDSSPILTAGRILLPAAESNQLYCLDMETGKTLWEVPRGDGLFVATCTERHCLIVGERSLQAVRLSDGKIAWSQDIPTPVGRGVVTSGQYILPVTTDELLSIDLRTGRILARIAADPAHHVGSLVSSRGQLLMQSTSEIVGLRPLSEVTTSIAQDLNTKEQRARALSEQGEILMFQGEAAQAELVLRESLQLQDSAPTRRLLVWSLLDRLKADYSKSRELVPELKKMATDLDQRTMLNRLHAEGLEKSGESLAAFREYLELVAVVPAGDSMLELSFEHQVREDRWLRGRLTHLFETVDESQRTQMRTILNDFVSRIDVNARTNFASVLGIELVPELHLELARTNRLDSFLTQRVFWNLSESNEVRLQAPAVAALVRHEVSQQRSAFVKPLLTKLRNELASIECEPGVTGSQLLEQLRMDPQYQKIDRQLTETDSLPEVSANTGGGALQQREVFPVLGARRGPFADWLFTLETNPGQTAQSCDGTGRTRHTLNLDILGERNLRPVRYVQTDSQLVLLAFRDRFVVISPMDQGGGQNQFQTRAMATLAEQSTTRDRQQRIVDVKPGVRDGLFPAGENGYFGNVGPLTYDTLCYQSGDEVMAIAPHLKDRKVLWKRSGVPPGSEICADANYVVLIPPLLGKLIVLRSSDGVQLAERTLPKGLAPRKRADWGRLFLVQRETPAANGGTPASVTWGMYDPVTDRDAWSVSLPVGTQWAPVDGEDLAFLEPTGTLHLVDDQSGREIWKSAAASELRTPFEFTVQVDQERLYLQITNAPQSGQPLIREFTQPGNGSAFHVNGPVVALDRRDGQVLWSRTVEQQMFRTGIPVGSGLLAYSALRKVESPEKPGEALTNSLLLLDRRTGEPVVDRNSSRAGAGDGWSRPSSGVMLMRVAGQDFRLTWDVDSETNSPPAAPEQDEPVTEDPVKMQ